MDLLSFSKFMGPYGLKCHQKVEGNPITGLLLYLEPDSQLTHYQPFQSLSICPSTVISDIVPIDVPGVRHLGYFCDPLTVILLS